MACHTPLLKKQGKFPLVSLLTSPLIYPWACLLFYWFPEGTRLVWGILFLMQSPSLPFLLLPPSLPLCPSSSSSSFSPPDSWRALQLQCPAETHRQTWREVCPRSTEAGGASVPPERESAATIPQRKVHSILVYTITRVLRADRVVV